MAIQAIIRSYSRYKVTDYEMRHWTTVDQKYWILKFNIGNPRLLEKYNVAPLAYYKMTKEDDQGKESSITIKGLSIYGYSYKVMVQFILRSISLKLLTKSLLK